MQRSCSIFHIFVILTERHFQVDDDEEEEFESLLLLMFLRTRRRIVTRRSRSSREFENITQYVSIESLSHVLIFFATFD